MSTDLFDEFSTVMTSETATTCPSCEAASAETRLLQVDMADFVGKLVKQTRCANCGYSTAVTVDKGTLDYLGAHFELKLCEESDWRQRKLIKSTTTFYSIPEIGLESARSGDCQNITVLELLLITRAELAKSPSFDSGASHAESMLKLSEFLEKLDEIIEGSAEATLIIQDPRQKMCFIEKKLNAADGEDFFHTTVLSNLSA